MKTATALTAALALAGIGFTVGALSGGGGSEAFEAAGGPETEVVVVTEDGDERSYTLSEAASRLEYLEAAVRRRRSRTRRLPDPDEDAFAADAGDDAPPALYRPDGTPYPLEDVVGLALESDDLSTRKAAVRALRRFNDDRARAALQKILGDEDAPPALRAEAAKALTRWPHRDYLPEELVAALSREEDPAVRVELAFGVSRLRERGAYMSEISDLLDAETDPKVRGQLFAAVARASRDPAARAELLDIAVSSDKPVEERRAALSALGRGRPSQETVDLVMPLLGDSDPVVRERALRILAGSRNMTLDTLTTGMSDDDGAVRARALAAGLKHLNRFRKDKNLPPEAYADAVREVVRLSTSDPDGEVRRSGVSNVWRLPKQEREPVLAAGRADPDPRVRLTAYAGSGRATARTATPQFVSALRSDDPWLRDYAYRQLQRLHDVDAPYSAAWNDKARDTAIREIEQQVSRSGN